MTAEVVMPPLQSLLEICSTTAVTVKTIASQIITFLPHSTLHCAQTEVKLNSVTHSLLCKFFSTYYGAFDSSVKVVGNCESEI